MTKQKMEDEIWKAAEECFPEEMCGFIVAKKRKPKFVQCENISEDPNSFVINPRDVIKAENIGKIITLVHSHCNKNPQPSQADLVECEKSMLPWLIVSLPSRTKYEFKPAGYEAPLIGRTFSHGVLDCYTLLRDYYKKELGIIIPDFERDYKWWKKGENLYLDNFSKAGFIQVYDQRIHDVLLLQMDSPVPNHAAVLIEGGKIIHHIDGQLSCEHVYGGFWRKNTWCTLRHKDMMK
jgi:proteasome lid subunit RPN8/RPN11